MTRKMMQRLALLAVVWLPPLALSAPAGAEWPRTLFVANNGVDSAACGTDDAPCRSISRAIRNARDGDQLIVGPGRYGDVNSDGDFNDPGDEAAEQGKGCRCMVRVDKRLRIESLDGADATVLEARGARLDVVAITANEAVFGGRERGFTLRGAAQSGDDDGAGLKVVAERGVQVLGNAAVGNRHAGFVLQGARHTARDNLSSRNGQGFSLAFTGEGHVLEGNVATANGNNEDFGHGFTLFGNNHSVVSNRAIANQGLGFLILAADGAGLSFRENEAIGNRGPGIHVQEGPELSLRGNNLYGNLGEGMASVLPAARNCGLVNDSGSTVDATFNFWGAPAGPGPDPADHAGPGSGCDLRGVTDVGNFEPRPQTLEQEQAPRGIPEAE